MRRWIFVGTCAVTLPASLAAQQWPNWRGPSASGVSPAVDLPVAWSDTQNVAWKAAVRSVVETSPLPPGRIARTPGPASGSIRNASAASIRRHPSRPTARSI